MLTNYLIFSIVFLLFAFIVFRVKVKKDYMNRQKLSVFSSILEVLVFAIHGSSLYLVLPTKWPYLPQMPENLVVTNVFRVMIVVGIIILFISWFKLGTKASMGADKNRLQTGGLYRYSRNPQMLGYGLMITSFLVAYFSYLVLIWFLLFIIAAFFMIKSEEEFLYQKYKEEYRDYCKQVPRIIKIEV